MNEGLLPVPFSLKLWFIFFLLHWAFQVRLVTDKETNKPRGYAFIEYMHTRDMKGLLLFHAKVSFFILLLNVNFKHRFWTLQLHISKLMEGNLTAEECLWMLSAVELCQIGVRADLVVDLVPPGLGEKKLTRSILDGNYPNCSTLCAWWTNLWSFTFLYYEVLGKF